MTKPARVSQTALLASALAACANNPSSIAVPPTLTQPEILEALDQMEAENFITPKQRYLVSQFLNDCNEENQQDIEVRRILIQGIQEYILKKEKGDRVLHNLNSGQLDQTPEIMKIAMDRGSFDITLLRLRDQLDGEWDAIKRSTQNPVDTAGVEALKKQINSELSTVKDSTEESIKILMKFAKNAAEAHTRRKLGPKGVYEQTIVALADVMAAKPYLKDEFIGLLKGEKEQVKVEDEGDISKKVERMARNAAEAIYATELSKISIILEAGIKKVARSR